MKMMGEHDLAVEIITVMVTLHYILGIGLHLNLNSVPDLPPTSLEPCFPVLT